MNTPLISIIAIVAHHGAIGIGGDQPFHIREDFLRFKQLTMGKPIVMGRLTFEALPKGALPGRRNIVVTRNEKWSAPDTERASSIEEAVQMCASADEIMIIGGGQIYARAMPIADTLYITDVDAEVPDADTFFPEVDTAEWKQTDRSEIFTDPRSGAEYSFVTYRRKSPQTAT